MDAIFSRLGPAELARTQLSTGILAAMPEPSGWGNTLKKLRTDAGLSPAELASEAGVHESTIYRAEAGETELDTKTLRGVARALEITLSDLVLTLEGIPTAGRLSADEAIKEGVQGRVLSGADIRRAASLVSIFLDAAQRSRRANARAVLEELATAVALVAAPGLAEETKQHIRATRAREAG